jgi:branched-chain amino acid transport system ATP-binding protein
MTVLFVEHDMHMVRTIADWVIVMAEGRIVAEGYPDAVMSDPAVIDAYLGAHHDTDLGSLTGQLEVANDIDPHLAEEIEAEIQEEAEIEQKGAENGK